MSTTVTLERLHAAYRAMGLWMPELDLDQPEDDRAAEAWRLAASTDGVAAERHRARARALEDHAAGLIDNDALVRRLDALAEPAERGRPDCPYWSAGINENQFRTTAGGGRPVL